MHIQLLSIEGNGKFRGKVPPKRRKGHGELHHCSRNADNKKTLIIFLLCFPHEVHCSQLKHIMECGILQYVRNSLLYFNIYQICCDRQLYMYETSIHRLKEKQLPTCSQHHFQINVSQLFMNATQTLLEDVLPARKNISRGFYHSTTNKKASVQQSKS